MSSVAEQIILHSNNNNSCTTTGEDKNHGTLPCPSDILSRDRSCMIGE